jgi:Neuraminidase (sialidase)
VFSAVNKKFSYPEAMKTFFFLTTFFISPLFTFAQQPDIQINPNFTWNGENSLAVNPTNPDNLIVAWMKLTSLTQVTIAISRSMDGGNTWLDPVYLPHFSSTFTSADPTLVFADNGTAYFGYIDYNKTSLDSGSVYVCKSIDGGASWTQPVKTMNFNSTTRLGY